MTIIDEPALETPTTAHPRSGGEASAHVTIDGIRSWCRRAPR
jgi:hypothetical protein